MTHLRGNFLHTHLRTIAALAFGLIFSITVVHATPPGSPYTAGETLDPNCAPGDTFCTVDVGGSGSGVLSDITAATATNTINSGNYQQEWQWNTLGAGSGLKLSSTSTAAASNLQKVLEISLSGANATSTQNTYGVYSSNTHTGTSARNYGVYGISSGGTINYGVYGESVADANNNYGVLGKGHIAVAGLAAGFSNNAIGVAGDGGSSTGNIGVKGYSSGDTGIGVLGSYMGSGSGALTGYGVYGDTSLSSINTTAGNAIMYGGYFNGAATEVAGSNILTNVGLYATASGGDVNYAAIFDQGNVGITTTAPSAKLHIKTDSLGTTQADSSGIFLQNTTTAAAGAQQISPALVWEGRGWKTSSGGASQKVDFRSYVLPVQASAAPRGQWLLQSAINGGAYTTALQYDTQTGLTITGNVNSSSSFQTTTGSVSTGNGLFITTATGAISLNGSVGTAGQVLTSAGVGATPTWSSGAAVALPSTYIAYGGAGNTLTSSSDITYDINTGIFQVQQARTRLIPSVLTMPDDISITPSFNTVSEQINTQPTGTLTVNAPESTSLTPYNGERITLRIQSTNVQTFAWDAIYSGNMPTATTGGDAWDIIGFIYNSNSLKWDFTGSQPSTGGSLPTTPNALYFNDGAGVLTTDANFIYDGAGGINIENSDDGNIAIDGTSGNHAYFGMNGGNPFIDMVDASATNVFSVTTGTALTYGYGGNRFLDVNNDGGYYAIGDIDETSTGDKLYVDASNSTAYFDNVAHDMRVGINNTNPIYSLDVIGSMNVSDGSQDFLTIDTNAFETDVGANDGTGIAQAIFQADQSGGDVGFNIYTNDGFNTVQITGDAVAGTVTSAAPNGWTHTGDLAVNGDINIIGVTDDAGVANFNVYTNTHSSANSINFGKYEGTSNDDAEFTVQVAGGADFAGNAASISLDPENGLYAQAVGGADSAIFGLQTNGIVTISATDIISTSATNGWQHTGDFIVNGSIDLDGGGSTNSIITTGDTVLGNIPTQGIVFSGSGIIFYGNSINGYNFISSAGPVTIANLAGTGTRTVVADTNGVLSAPVSDRSVKENIQTLEYGLDAVRQLNPVSFEYIDGWKRYGQGMQIGFIAQDIQQVLPHSVFTTPSTGKMGYNEIDLVPVLAKAIQDIDFNIMSIADLDRPNTWRDALVEWFASVTNGIGKIFAGEVETKNLCVSDDSGAKTCITKDQLDTLLQNQSITPPPPAIPPDPDPSTPDDGGTPPTDTPPDDGSTPPADTPDAPPAAPEPGA